MTFRARPVVKRTQKPNWESRDRRNFYLNLGFGLVVLAAVLILAIAVAINYYNEHLASVGSVDGQSITRDDFRQRGTIEQWRLDEAGRRIQTLLVAGRLTQAQADLQKQYLQQQAQQIGTFVLERIIDSRILAKLAPAEGVTVTAAPVRRPPPRSRRRGPRSPRHWPTSRVASRGTTSPRPCRPTRPRRRRPATWAGCPRTTARPTRRSSKLSSRRR